MKKELKISVSREQIIFLLYALFTLLLLVKHEPWEDELQSWCIAQSLSIPEILYQMRYEGHFALWHLLLKPLTALHLPLFFMGILAWGLCMVAGYLFMTKGSFTLATKSLILLSLPVLYYFPVIARNYALIPPVLVGLAAYYPVRLRKPWHYGIFLILLVHTHAYMCGLAGVLGIFFAFELLKRPNKWKSLTVLMMIGVGVLAAFLQVAPAFGTTNLVPSEASGLLAQKDILSKIGNTLSKLPILHCDKADFLPSSLQVIIYYAALVAGWFGLLWRSWKLFVIFFFAIMWQILFGTLIYPINLQRIFLPYLILIFCYIIPVPSKRSSFIPIQIPHYLRNGAAALGILAVVTFPASLFFVKNDLTKSFSNQKNIAVYIRNNVPADAKIVVFPDTLITGTFGAYLPGRVFHHSTDNQPFTLFCMAKGPMPKTIDSDLLARYAGDCREFYMLFQFGAYLLYRLPYKQHIFRIGNYDLEIVACTLPMAFFSAGENYIMLKVTRK